MYWVRGRQKIYQVSFHFLRAMTANQIMGMLYVLTTLHQSQYVIINFLLGWKNGLFLEHSILLPLKIYSDLNLWWQSDKDIIQPPWFVVIARKKMKENIWHVKNILFVSWIDL